MARTRTVFTIAIIALLMCAWLVQPQPPTAQASTSALNIVYPADGARLPFLKRSFIFGSARPGSKVSVNGMQAFIAASGGWIAFVPLSPGTFRLRVVASAAGDRVFAERVISVASPPRTTPATPARVDASMAAPWQDVVVRQLDTVRLLVKASVGAHVTASFGTAGTTVRLSATDVSRLSPSESKRVLGGAFAREVTIGGLYRGELRVPATARGLLSLRYNVVAADGSTARAVAKGRIDVVPLGWHRVGYIVPGDHQKDIDARPFGVVESEPRGDWLFTSPANTIFEVIGAAGDYYRVALSSDQDGWILKHSLRLLPPGTQRPRANVRDVELFDQGRWGIVAVRMTDKLPFWVEELPDRPGLRVHLYGVSALADFGRAGEAGSNIAAIRSVRESDGTAAIDVQLRQRVMWGYRAQWNGDDLELAIKRPPLLVPSPSPVLSGLVIVIDPGHSPDAGAIGPLGTEERDVNLAIAKRLAIHLEDLGARAILTRTANVPVGLYDRTAFAAQQNADILISVHNNALPDGSDPFAHHGFSVYYFRPQSLGLARAIHSAYLKRLQLPDDGLYKDELALTRATEEPAVLTETAFIMWPPEEMDLRSPTFQDNAARTIAEGVSEWVATARSEEIRLQSTLDRS